MGDGRRALGHNRGHRPGGEIFRLADVVSDVVKFSVVVFEEEDQLVASISDRRRGRPELRTVVRIVPV